MRITSKLVVGMGWWTLCDWVWPRERLSPWLCRLNVTFGSRTRHSVKQGLLDFFMSKAVHVKSLRSAIPPCGGPCQEEGECSTGEEVQCSERRSRKWKTTKECVTAACLGLLINPGVTPTLPALPDSLVWAMLCVASTFALTFTICKLGLPARFLIPPPVS